MRVGSIAMAAASHGRQGGGERGGGGGGGGGGGAEGSLMLKNHSASIYTGWVWGTMPLGNQDQAGTGWYTDGTRLIGFGRNVGQDRRMVWVRIPAGGIGVGASLAIDLETTTSAAPPAMGTLADVPSVGGIPLTLQTTTDDGPIRIYRYQGKLNTWFTATIWIYYAHGHNVHRLEFIVTQSNCSDPDMDHKPVPTLTVTIGAGTVTWCGTLPAFGGGLTFGPDSAQVFYGALRYGAVGADIASASCLTDHPVECWCPENAGTWPPFGEAATVGTAFNANTFRTANLATLKTNVGTLAYSGLGPHPNSGRTGDQESEGWASCGEPFDPDHANAGTIWVNQLGISEISRRNINYRESDGNLISPIVRNRAFCWVGNPWQPDNADLLGKLAGKTVTESNVITAGGGERWFGPEGQHHFMNRLGEGYLLTGSLALQEILLTWGINFLLQEHTNTSAPNTRNSNSNTPRSMGWASLTAVWLYASIDDRNFAELIRFGWLARVEQVYLTRTLQEISTYGKPGPQIFTPSLTLGAARGWEISTQHLQPANFDPAGLAVDRYPGAYVEGVSPDQAVILIWQHSLGAGGLYCAWARMGGQVAYNLAMLLAEPLISHGWFLDGATYRMANTIGVNLQNQLTGNRFSDDVYDQWGVWGVAAFLRMQTPSHPLYAKALAVWNQQSASYAANNAVLKWIMPI